jgi:hypothetical protein
MYISCSHYQIRYETFHSFAYFCILLAVFIAYRHSYEAVAYVCKCWMWACLPACININYVEM